MRKRSDACLMHKLSPARRRNEKKQVNLWMKKKQTNESWTKKESNVEKGFSAVCGFQDPIEKTVSAFFNKYHLALESIVLSRVPW